MTGVLWYVISQIQGAPAMNHQLRGLHHCIWSKQMVGRSAAGFLVFALPLWGFANPAQDELERLRSQVRKQQEEIDELRKRLDAQQQVLERLLPATAPQAAVPAPVATPTPPDSAPVRGPLSFNLGGLTITPTG